MSYGQELRMIAAEAERREQALGRLAFCFEVWLDFTQNAAKPTEDMNAARATAQLANAIRASIGLPEDKDATAYYAPTATRTTDLNDPAAPQGVPDVLRFAAEKMREQTSELQSAHQDANAGKVWNRIARILETAAARVERTLD